jgi:amino acid transporter
VILVVTETVLVVAYTVAIMFTPGFEFTFAPLSAGNLSGPTAGVLLVIAMTSFTGVEQSEVYSEEARNPRRTVPIATYGTIAIITVLYVFTSLVQISAAGSEVVKTAGEQGGDLFFNLAAPVVGSDGVSWGRIQLALSLVAAMIAFHNAVSRYGYSLGREGVMWRRLGDATIKGAPRKASLVQSVLALGVLVLYAVAGWDPLLNLFYLGTTTGGLGVLLLILATSIAVICYFARDSRGENVWRRAIAPAITTVVLLVVAYFALDNLSTLYGVDPGTGPARIVPYVFLGLFVAGTAWGLSLKRRRPDVYRGIGHGARSVAAATSGLAGIFTTPERTTR